MKISRPRAAAIAVFGCCAILLPVALASGRAPRTSTVSAACSASHTIVWLGDGEGGGTLGHVYYPLEFSNAGHSSCTLYGYPGVSAWGGGGQIGDAAGRSGGPVHAITLAGGATAHALLAIADWGAICSHAVSAEGLRIYPPGQRQGQDVLFALQVCAHRSVLTVEPVRPGVGIPGYTNS